MIADHMDEKKHNLRVIFNKILFQSDERVMHEVNLILTLIDMDIIRLCDFEHSLVILIGESRSQLSESFLNFVSEFLQRGILERQIFKMEEVPSLSKILQNDTHPKIQSFITDSKPNPQGSKPIVQNNNEETNMVFSKFNEIGDTINQNQQDLRVISIKQDLMKILKYVWEKDMLDQDGN